MAFFNSKDLMENQVYKEVLPTSDLFKLPPIFCQRNHELRASKVAKEIAKNPFLPTGLEIALVEYPNGNREIANGNTRLYIWQNFDEFGVNAPSHLLTTTYKVCNKEDARRIYESFDSMTATETSKHKITGIYRQLGLTPSDRTIAMGMVGKAFSYGCVGYVDEDGETLNGKEMLKNIANFREELNTLDSIGLGGKSLKGQPIIAASLMVLKKYGYNNPKVKVLLKNLKNGTPSNYDQGDYYIINELPTRLGDTWGKTDGNSMPINLNHILYCMDKFIDGEPIQRFSKVVNTYYSNFWDA